MNYTGKNKDRLTSVEKTVFQYDELNRWIYTHLPYEDITDLELNHIKSVLLRDQALKKTDGERISRKIGQFPTKLRPELLLPVVEELRQKSPPAPGSGLVSLCNPVLLESLSQTTPTSRKSSPSLLQSMVNKMPGSQSSSDDYRKRLSLFEQERCAICSLKTGLFRKQPICDHCQRIVCNRCLTRLYEDSQMCKDCLEMARALCSTGDWFAQYLASKEGNPIRMAEDLPKPPTSRRKSRFRIEVPNKVSQQPVRTPDPQIIRKHLRPILEKSGNSKIQEESTTNLDQHTLKARRNSNTRTSVGAERVEQNDRFNDEVKPKFLSLKSLKENNITYHRRSSVMAEDEKIPSNNLPRTPIDGSHKPELSTRISVNEFETEACNTADETTRHSKHHWLKKKSYPKLQRTLSDEPHSTEIENDKAEMRQKSIIRHNILSAFLPGSKKPTDSSDLEYGYRNEVGIQGTIEVSLEYDGPHSRLLVHLWGAKNIAAADKKTGLSSPFARIYLYPDTYKHTKQKITYKGHSCSPVFNAGVCYSISPTELAERVVVIELWHKRSMGSSLFLGEAVLPLHDYKWTDKEKKRLSLKEKQMLKSSHTEPSYRGEINVEIRLTMRDAKQPQAIINSVQSEIPGTLEIRLVEAQNLYSNTVGMNVTAFVKASIISNGLQIETKSTDCIPKTHNPRWNSVLRFDEVSQADLLDMAVELSVWHRPAIYKPPELLGVVRLSTDSIDNGSGWKSCNKDEMAFWTEVTKKTEFWISRKLALHG